MGQSLRTVVASVGSGEVRGTLSGFEPLDPRDMTLVESEAEAEPGRTEVTAHAKLWRKTKTR